MRRLAIVAAVVLVASACAKPDVALQTESGFGTTSMGPVESVADPNDPGTLVEPDGFGEVERPPEVIVRGGGVQLSLEAWTACWSNGCYDGPPPELLPDVGSPTEVVVEFPVSGWEFSATVQPVDEECGRRQTEPLERIGETLHRLEPIGAAGDYEVTLFGRGQGGDLFVSFRWQTTTDGVMPVPAATASILADHDGEVDSYGVELPVWNLAATPESASARVQVTAANGNSHTITLTRADLDCTEGTLYFTASDVEGLAATQLGPAPFTYEVTLELDGDTYIGAGTWPDDVDPECDPCVPLSFDPPLPALNAVTTVSGIEAIEVDGVWVFQHRPGGWDDALHSGTPTIVDGCLYVDNTIVVWHVDRLDKAADAIAAARAGETPTLLIGGGGISLDEGASPNQLPSVITDRCPTSAVWFGAP